MTQIDRSFRTAVEALGAGDFSSLDPLFQGRDTDAGRGSQIEAWYHAGRFASEP